MDNSTFVKDGSRMEHSNRRGGDMYRYGLGEYVLFVREGGSHIVGAQHPVVCFLRNVRVRVYGHCYVSPSFSHSQ